MMTKGKARGLMRLIPEKGTAVVTLDADFSAVAQSGTISASGSTITGIGTAFQSQIQPIVAGSVIIANSETLNVVSVSSDTSLIVSQTGLSFSGQSYVADRTTVLTIYGAWAKQTSGGLGGYGNANVEQSRTSIMIPDYELNPNNDGREIRARDTISFDGSLYRVTGTGGNLKTVRTVWECQVQQEFN